jgi:hypothetical protein
VLFTRVCVCGGGGGRRLIYFANPSISQPFFPPDVPFRSFVSSRSGFFSSFVGTMALLSLRDSNVYPSPSIVEVRHQGGDQEREYRPCSRAYQYAAWADAGDRR